jgi:hypothetical protein
MVLGVYHEVTLRLCSEVILITTRGELIHEVGHITEVVS